MIDFLRHMLRTKTIFADRHILLREGRLTRQYVVTVRQQMTLVTVLTVLAVLLIVGIFNTGLYLNDRISRVHKEQQIHTLEQESARLKNTLYSVKTTLKKYIEASKNGHPLELMAQEQSSRIQQLESELNQTVEYHNTAVSLLLEITKKHNENLAKDIASTGLKLESLLMEETTTAGKGVMTGTGGRFIRPTLDKFDSVILDKQTSNSTQELMKLAFQNLVMLNAVDRLPITSPVRDDHWISSDYGLRKDPFNNQSAWHEGIDYAAPTGTPIYATASGEVVSSGWNGGYGMTVVIEHSGNLKTRYAHLKKSLVKPGQSVDRGDKIALMGSTGRSTGSHLHYEIVHDEDPINPSKLTRLAKYVQ